MSSISQRSVVSSAGCFLSALFAVSVLTGGYDLVRDGATDDMISPWCEIGSPASWEGRPCVISMGAVPTEAMAGGQ
jgi:hypothetical protein